MLSSFSVENYRCLSDVTLKDLKRVNLITGINNVGKTSLLEALFIYCGTSNPELLLRVNTLRGYSEFAIQLDSFVSPPWIALFKEFNLSNPIYFRGFFKGTGARTIKISHSPKAHSESVKFISVKQDESSYASLVQPFLSATLTVEEVGDKRAYSIIFDQNGMRVEPTPPPPPFPGIFLAARSRLNFKEEANRFGNLDKRKEKAIVIDALKIIDNRIKDVSLVLTGNEPVLNADIGISHLVPLPDMGEGIVRLLSIIVAIANSPNGVVIIDEIENGFHYSCLGNLWKVIDEVSERTNTQVFLTTHSLECIKNAHAVFAEGDYDFALFRLDRIREDIEVVRYDKDTLGSSFEFGMDVR